MSRISASRTVVVESEAPALERNEGKDLLFVAESIAKDLKCVVLSKAKDLLLLALMITLPHTAPAQLSGRQKSDD